MLCVCDWVSVFRVCGLCMWVVCTWGEGRAGCLAVSEYFLRSSSGALGCRAPSRAAAAAETVMGRCEEDRDRRCEDGSLKFRSCWSSDDKEEEVSLLKSSGAAPPLPLTTSVSLTIAPSVTAEDGGVRAGRPIPPPFSDEESSENRKTEEVQQQLIQWVASYPSGKTDPVIIEISEESNCWHQ